MEFNSSEIILISFIVSPWLLFWKSDSSTLFKQALLIKGLKVCLMNRLIIFESEVWDSIYISMMIHMKIRYVRLYQLNCSLNLYH